MEHDADRELITRAAERARDHTRARGPYRTDARHECEAAPTLPIERELAILDRRIRRECAMAGVGVALALLSFGWLLGTVGAQDAGAQDAEEQSGARAGAALDRDGGAPPERVEADRLTAALARALTIWERPSDGRVVYVHHCRTAPGGCDARLRAIALEMIRAGRIHGVDPWLLAAMAYRESGLNPDAIGAVGEVGVLQLHPRSARGRRALAACARAPSRCTAAVIWLAAEGLAASIARCGSEPAALGAYNRGHCGATSYSTRVLRQRGLLLAWATESISAEVTAAEGDGPSSAADCGPDDARAGGDPS